MLGTLFGLLLITLILLVVIGITARVTLGP
jgi:hypothetical protein